MSVRFYLLGLAISGLLCLAAFVLTIVNTNPGEGHGALASFYVSGFFAVFSIATLLGYAVRRSITGNELRYANLQVAFRQAVLVALLLVVLLLLQGFRLVSWWDLVLLAMITVLVELYLRAHARPHQF